MMTWLYLHWRGMAWVAVLLILLVAIPCTLIFGFHATRPCTTFETTEDTSEYVISTEQVKVIRKWQSEDDVYGGHLLLLRANGETVTEHAYDAYWTTNVGDTGYLCEHAIPLAYWEILLEELMAAMIIGTLLFAGIMSWGVCCAVSSRCYY